MLMPTSVEALSGAKRLWRAPRGLQPGHQLKPTMLMAYIGRAMPAAPEATFRALSTIIAGPSKYKPDMP